MGARCCVEAVRRVARNCWKTFDEAKDMCDHFASNPSNLGRTSTGVSKIFSRGLLSHSQTAKSAWMHHHFKTINKRSLIDFSGLSLMMVLNFYVWQGAVSEAIQARL